jgi:hypothetical protein
LLEDHTLTVRQWFNVESETGRAVRGGVWEIAEEHLPRLDRYEDCPGLYERREMRVFPFEHGGMGEREHGGESDARIPVALTRGHGDTETRREIVSCLVYIMSEPFAIPLSPPEPGYLEMVREGYREWRISSGQVEGALRVVSNI